MLLHVFEGNALHLNTSLFGIYMQFFGCILEYLNFFDAAKSVCSLLKLCDFLLSLLMSTTLLQLSMSCWQSSLE